MMSTGVQQLGTRMCWHPPALAERPRSLARPAALPGRAGQPVLPCGRLPVGSPRTAVSIVLLNRCRQAPPMDVLSPMGPKGGWSTTARAMPCPPHWLARGPQAVFPPNSCWVISGIDCSTPTVRGSLGCSNIPPPVLPRASCLQAGKGLHWLQSHWPPVWDKPQHCPCHGDKCSCRDPLCYTAVPHQIQSPPKPLSQMLWHLQEHFCSCDFPLV